jgi:hypothetical protein
VLVGLAGQAGTASPINGSVDSMVREHEIDHETAAVRTD